MASSGAPPPSLRQGVRIMPPDSGVTVEEVLLAVGEQVGHDNLSFASRMNRAVVVFLKEETHVYQLIESGVFIRDTYVQVSPMSAPSTRITVSGVPPFISSEAILNELRRFGKFASGLKTVSLGCKDPKLRHVQSLRRQVLMFLDSPAQSLEVSFRVKHGDGAYMLYASSGQLRCFECGDMGHKRFACPRRKQAGSAAAGEGAATGETATGRATTGETTTGRAATGETTTGGAATGETATGRAATGEAATGEAETGEAATGEAATGEAATGEAATGEAATGEAATGEAETGEAETGGAATGEMETGGAETGEAATGGAAAVCGVGRAAGGGPDAQLREEQQKQAEEQQVTAAAESISSQALENMEEEASTSGKDLRGGAGAEQGVPNSQESCRGDMVIDSGSDAAPFSAKKSTDLYSLEEINSFLDETFNKTAKVSDYFRDTSKFIRSVGMLNKLDERKRYRLKKHITYLRGAQEGKVVKKRTKRS